jgi:hypothetical protein
MKALSSLALAGLTPLPAAVASLPATERQTSTFPAPCSYGTDYSDHGGRQ